MTFTNGLDVLLSPCILSLRIFSVVSVWLLRPMGRNPFLQSPMVNKKHCCLHLLANTSMWSSGGYFKLCFDNAERSGLGCSVAKAFDGIAVAQQDERSPSWGGKDHRFVYLELFCCDVDHCPVSPWDCCQMSWQEGHGHKCVLGWTWHSGLGSSKKINYLWAGSRVG